MNQNQYPNGVFYGQAQQASGFPAPMQMAGQPSSAPGFNGQIPVGNVQPAQYYVPQQGGNPAQAQGGAPAPGQNPNTQGNGNQQDSIRYTQILC